MSVPTVLLLVVVALLGVLVLIGRSRERQREVVERLAEPMSLREAAGRVGVTLDVLRRASSRDPRFPRPRRRGPNGAGLYDLAELRAWERSRRGRPRQLQRGLDRAHGLDDAGR